MRQPEISVTEKPSTSNSETVQLPDIFSEGAVLISSLRATICGLAERWPSRRRAGARGNEVVFGFLITFFAQRVTRSLREFSGFCKGFERVLAALVGRRLWLTQPSLSRALDSCSQEDADTVCSWLLTEGLARPERAWLDTALTGMRDTAGNVLHLFDLDPTAKAFRRRALPEGDDLPAPDRRAKDIAAPGHLGRKRGQAIASRVPVQHAGSGLWVANIVYRGNADYRDSVNKGIDHIGRWCAHMGVDAARALLRFDGGISGGIEACQQRNFDFLTRLNHYKPLGGRDVRAHLEAAEWSMVPDSKSGPRRTATELGLVSIAGRAPTRVVVARFPNTGGGAGKVIGKDRYELFATSLDAAAWPAAELVALYYQRATQENQFAREDAELGLDRAYAYKQPGLQIVTTIGLFVWNLRTLNGAELHEVSIDKLPPQGKRDLEVGVAPSFSENSTVDERQEETDDPKRALVQAVVDAPSGRVLDSLMPEGWKLEPEAGGLRCPNGALLRVQGTAPKSRHGRHYVLLRAGKAACRQCPLRSQCTTSTNPTFRREVQFQLFSVAASMPIHDQTQEWTPPAPTQAGPLAAAGQHIRTADLRHLASRLFTAIKVIITAPEPLPLPAPSWLAVDDAARQQRRKSFEQRRNDEQLAKPVKVQFSAPRSVMRLLGRA